MVVPTYIQSAINEHIIPTSPFTATFGSGTTGGNLIVVIWANQGSTFTGPPSISDNKSNVYSLAVSFVDNVTTNGQMFMFYSANTTSGVTSISSSFTGTVDMVGLYGFEIHGANTFDAGVGNGGISSSASSGNFTTNFSNEIIIAATINSTGGSSAGSGMTLIELTPNFSDILEYEIIGSGVQNVAANLSGSQTWDMIAGGFVQTPPSGFLGSVYGKII